MRTFGTILLAWLLFANVAQAAPFYYGGRVTNAAGAPLVGPVDLTVSFYRDGTTTTPILSTPVSVPNVPLVDGVFSAPVTLSPTDLEAVFVDFDTPVFIEVTDVTDGNSPKVYPRQQFSLVPYAAFARRIPVDNQTLKFVDGKLEVDTSNLGSVKLGAGDTLGLGTHTSTPTCVAGNKGQIWFETGSVRFCDGTTTPQTLSTTGAGGITPNSADTLTNKTIDGDDNTLQDVGDASLKAGIDASKIGGNTNVSNAEFGFLDGVTGAIQGQIDGKAATSHSHANATTGAAGFMSAADKTAHDGLVTSITGKVDGPASATDNAVVRFDGATGKLVQNSGVVIDDVGNLGIGTASPTHRLQVKADTSPGFRVHGVSGAAYSRVDVNTITNGFTSENVTSCVDCGAGFGFSLAYDGTVTAPGAKIGAGQEGAWTTTNSTQDSYLQFSTALDGTVAEKARISSQGYLGIGTTNPGAPLDVKGAIRMTGATSGFVGLQPAAAAGSTTYTLPASPTAGGYLTTDGSGVLTWGTPAGSGGDITDVNAGTGLTGGNTTSGAASIAVDFGSGAGKVTEGNDARLSDSRAPNGSASGDLSGSYPGPTVAKLQGRNVDSAAPGANTYLMWDGTKWAASSAGSVTQVATGLGLQGGPINGTGTVDLRLNASGGLVKNLGAGTNELGIAASGVTDAMLAGSITQSKITNLTTDLAAKGDVFNGNQPAGALTVGTNNGTPLTLETNDAAAMTILANGRVGVGTTSAPSLLTVGTAGGFQTDANGDIVKLNGATTTFPSANASGVLTNNGSGTLTWAAASAPPAGASGEIQYNSGSSTMAASSNFKWNNAKKTLELDSGNSSILIGTSAGNANTGSDNVFIGQYAGLTNSSANSNTFLGTRAGQMNVTAVGNTYVGARAGMNATSADNTGIGDHALHALTTGSGNTALGQTAGDTLTTGASNTLIGASADVSANNIGNTVVIGSGASATGNNAVAIGQNVTAAANTVVVGNSSVTQTFLKGDVSIGTTNPSTTLHIEKTSTGDVGGTVKNASNGTNARALMFLRNDLATGYSSWIQTSSTYNGVAGWGNRSVFHAGAGTAGGILMRPETGGFQVAASAGSNDANLYVASSGNVSIGTTTAASQFNVGNSNQFQVNSSGNVVKLNGATTTFPSSNAAGALTNDGSGNLTWSSSGSSQWVTTGSDIYYNTGNVGIGTTSTPGSTLHLSKNSNNSSSALYPNLRVTNRNTTQGDNATTFNRSALILESGNAAVQGMIVAGYESAGPFANGLYVSAATYHPLHLQTNSATRMSIIPTGEVGIGTTSPAANLHVRQDFNGQTSLLVANNNATGASHAVMQATNGSDHAGLAMFGTGYTSSGAQVARGGSLLANGTGGLSVAATHASGDLRLYSGGSTDGNERMRISSAGQIGIGTTTPVVPLDFGSSALGKKIVFGAFTMSDNWVGLGLDGTGVTASLRLAGDQANSGGNETTMEMGYYSADASHTWNSQMAISRLGSVGIGTVTPGAKLDVDGSIKSRSTGFVFPNSTTQASAAVEIGRAYAYYDTDAYVSSSIPLDDTIPQSSEGDEIFTVTYTPRSATSRLRIEANVPVEFDANSAPVAGVIALFRDSGTNAIAANYVQVPTTDNGQGQLHLVHDVASGSTSATTFKVRVGKAGSSIGVMINGSYSRYFGGVLRSTLEVREYTE